MRGVLAWWAVGIVVAAAVCSLAYAFVVWRRDVHDQDEEG